jgi:hypothetical protein
MNFVAQMKKAGVEVATECTLLFGELPHIDPDPFLEMLSNTLDIETIRLVSDQHAGPNRYLTISAAGCRISIEFGNDIRPRAAYFEALEWPMLHQSFDDAEAMVTKHRASAHVTVETEFDAMATALGLSSTNSNFSRAKLAAAVAVTFCRFDMPEAIHWKPCEMLYRPGPFIRQFETDPISLFVRVTPFSSNREVGGVRVIGASTRAAADFLGLETVLEEAPVPVLWAMTTVEKFISQCHAHGTYLPHLASFSPMGPSQIRAPRADRMRGIADELDRQRKADDTSSGLMTRAPPFMARRDPICAPAKRRAHDNTRLPQHRAGESEQNEAADIGGEVQQFGMRRRFQTGRSRRARRRQA